MNRPRMFFRILAVAAGVATALALDNGEIFQPFPDDTGKVESHKINPSLGASNKFFDPQLGTNGQACVTCHQPAQGITIHVPNINQAFDATNGCPTAPACLDPLFRANDTADRPDADLSTPDARRQAFFLFLNMGVIRFGRPVPATKADDFIVEPQDTAQFGPLPNPNDPQAPGKQTLSVFRRPLVNTNVNFDSSVLWDGRASITDLRTQVKKAAKGLLLAKDVSDADADNVAAFMTGVFTDQVFDNKAGRVNAEGAKGGVLNLAHLALSPFRPCLFDATGAPTPFTPAATCTPVIPGNPNMSVFDDWAGSERPGRAQVARGQEVFNTANLTVPPDLVGQLGNAPIHCTTCHATNNLGNNPDGKFFVRIGTDSVDILSKLPDPDGLVKPILDNVKLLPQYCLRPASDPTPFSTSPCGNDPGDVRTTDPGRALVTGHIADLGKFKPPILRGLAARSPYFHAGVAPDISNVVGFYNARFNIGLTPEQRDDLGAFIDEAF